MNRYNSHPHTFTLRESTLSLAIFDLDNTLLAGDSDYLWGQFLIDKGFVDGDEYARANQYYYDHYQAGTLDIHEYARFAFKPLSEHPRSELERWRKEFLQDYIRPIMLDSARDLIESHKKQGDTLLVITATNRFVTEPIVTAYGIDNLLATDPREENGQFIAEIEGIPCFQEGKVERLQQWLKLNEHSLDNSWFYSDSHNDIPLLEQVSNPVAVDPDSPLRELAESRGWKVISLR
jgi:HAD superfamily hydrolase (TIGR01490 family)